MPVEVRLHRAGQLLQLLRRVATDRGGQDRVAGGVDPRAQEHRRGRQREVLAARGHHQRAGEPGAGRVARHDDAARPLRQQPAVRAQRVLDGRGERMLGGEPVVGHERADPRRGDEGADQRPVPVGGADGVAAAVQVEDRHVLLARRADHERRDAARVDRPDLDALGDRGLREERLVGRAHLLDVRTGGRDLEHRRPHGRHPVGQLAADGLRRGDRLVEVGEQLPRAVEQRAAGDGQLDAVRRAPQQLAPEQPLERADLAAERGLGEVQARGGPIEVELLGDGDERPQVPDLDALRRLGEREYLSAHPAEYAVGAPTW